MRALTINEIKQLESQGCTSNDWQFVSISPELDLKKISNVYFRGKVTIHKGVILRQIPGGLSGCEIKENAIVENVASIEFDADAKNGVGVKLDVLDETGSRNVYIYPGLSSQIATLMARDPEWLKKIEETSLPEFLASKATPCEIGEKAIVRNSGPLKNVSIGREVKVEGASKLENGSLVNNASPGKCFTYVGSAVEANNFILEDGQLESKTSITNCYIGQGSVMSLGFSGRDSLFFANCIMENGESHALLAGPHTVSMHKGTLLIGCQTSFFNAGSTTNQSNHMYKLGPVHWGLMERGVKTSSGSYLMLGAKIGAYSLLMGAHKTHPDSSDFPFSYLFGDEKGATVVVPAVLLRSCGLQRDEKKWPQRDKRKDRELPLHDHITYDVLNPYTVDTMLRAIHTIERLLNRQRNTLYLRYKGMKFTRTAMERAKTLYTNAIFKYLSLKLNGKNIPPKSADKPCEWMDLGGQIIPRYILAQILTTYNIAEVEAILSATHQRYKDLELKWIGDRFGEWWRKQDIAEHAKKFDEMVDEDLNQYRDMLVREQAMLSL